MIISSRGLSLQQQRNVGKLSPTSLSGVFTKAATDAIVTNFAFVQI